jgi:hypothetical protein
MHWSTQLFACSTITILISGCNHEPPKDARSLADQVVVLQNSLAGAADTRQVDQDTRILVEQIAAAQSSFAQPTSAEQAFEASSLLTEADILEITGARVIEKIPGDKFRIYENYCTWHLTTEGIIRKIELGVVSPGGRKYFDTGLALAAEKPLPGLGDVAIVHKSGSTAAVKGDTLVEVTYSSYPPRPEIPQRLIERIFSRLP